jgi:hypothetical protein
METYDSDFEGLRLSMLAKQYPEISSNECKFIFWADEKKSEFSHGTWICEDAVHEKIRESQFKMQFILLIENFIEYRAACNKFPQKEGVVRFGNEELEIEWVEDGVAEALKKSFS